MANGTELTLEMCEQTNFLDQIVGASAHPVRTSLLPEEEKVLMENGVPSFGRYFDLLGKQGKKIDPSGCSMRMLRECYQATEDLTSLPFSLKWIGGGMTSSGSSNEGRFH